MQWFLLLSCVALCSMAQGQGFVRIPGGTFTMGDPTGVGYEDETPHTVTLSTFYIASTETRYSEWQAVYVWALAHGYTFSHPGKGKGAGHPVHTVSWHDVLKWCNAKSEKHGRVPCYRLGAEVYKTGRKNPTCDWKVNGYRLPTESEWEKAARGKLIGKNFPWGNTISHRFANYYSSDTYAYDVSSTRGYHPTFDVGSYPYTSPVASFAANGHGLYDMAGNVWEWCWDRYGIYPARPVIDPRGSASGSDRAVRGGGWGGDAYYCRAADRGYATASASDDYIGFRLARSSVP